MSADMKLKMRELDNMLSGEMRMRKQAGESNIKVKDGKIVIKVEEGDAGNVPKRCVAIRITSIYQFSCGYTLSLSPVSNMCLQC